MDAAPRLVSPKALQARCDAFNARVAVGAEIGVWPGVKEGPPKSAVVRSPGAVVLGGHTAVVYVTGGYHGSIALSHVAEGPR